MRLSYADIFQHNTSFQEHGHLFRSMIRILTVESETFCWRDGTRIVSRENSFAWLFCSQKRAGKTSWLTVSYLISYVYVGIEQVPGALNAYDKDLLREYHYGLFKCFESAQRTTDAELCVVLSKRLKGEWHIQRFWLRNLYSVPDHWNICGIEISQCFTWELSVR